MDNPYWLDRISLSDRSCVGDRAFNLSQLLQNGYPVLPGFVVSASGFEEFIEILGESEPLLSDWPHSSFYVDVDNSRQLQLVAQQIRREIAAAALPETWTSILTDAAREISASILMLHPSLTLPVTPWQVDPSLSPREPKHEPEVSFQLSSIQPVGLLDSHSCLNQPEALSFALKRVWAELFRARNFLYWQRRNIGLRELNFAVLVQPIWATIASGTVETDAAEWQIQATWGVETALLKGEVMPDTYQVQRKTGLVKTRQLGSKTRAYCPRSSQDDSPTEGGLQAYLLSEHQQSQYALEETALSQLIELSGSLATELTTSFALDWTLSKPLHQSEPQLYLTHLMPRPQTRLHLERPASDTRAGEAKESVAPTPAIIDFSAQGNTSANRLPRGIAASSGRATAPAYVMTANPSHQPPLAPGRILVAPSITPDWLPWLKQAAGVVTERGGMTSHAAIIARELGIPAVVGVAGATQLIAMGEALLVDGERGEIHRLDDGASQEKREPIADSSASPSPLPATVPAEHCATDGRVTNGMSAKPQHSTFSFPYPIATQLLVNVSQPDTLPKIASLPVDGIGLLRSELMMLNALDNLSPREWQQQGREEELVARLTQLIVKFAADLAPRPVMYRSLDWRSHEFQFLNGDMSASQPERNPILGLRGTRRYLSDPTSFDWELAALGRVYQQGYGNVRLMLPFVRTVEEFQFCRRRVEQAGLTDNPHFQLWIVAEVPSVLFLLPDYVKAGVQGISIGTNDLTQLLLAADRDAEVLGSPLDGRHPAVRRALKHLIQLAKAAEIPCTICGQAPAGDPELIDSAIEWGITGISVDVNDVERTYMAIARAEQRLLLKAARQHQSG